jgi:hypothetical protein
MFFIGIDPGLQGGITILDNIGKVAEMHKMPVTEYGIDVNELYKIISKYDNNDTIGITEQIFLPSKQSGSVTVGTNYGRILAVFELLKITYFPIRPQEWQKQLIPGIKERKNVKEASIKMSLIMGADLPKIGKSDRSNKYHDGCADSFLIAQYGYLNEGSLNKFL